jgi:hypothetical protein
LTEEVNKENEQEDNPVNQLEQKMVELEQVVTEKEGEIAALRKSEGELKEKLSVVGKSLTEAVNSYKSRVIQMNPGITEELIEGSTVEEIDKSLEKALGLIGRVKKSVEKEMSHTRMPAGAPGRRPPDLSGLSPREKIQYAIGGKK